MNELPKPPPGHRWKVIISHNSMGSLYPVLELQRKVAGIFWKCVNSSTGSIATEENDLVKMADEVLIRRMRDGNLKQLAGVYA